MYLCVDILMVVAVELSNGSCVRSDLLEEEHKVYFLLKSVSTCTENPGSLRGEQPFAALYDAAFRDQVLSETLSNRL